VLVGAKATVTADELTPPNDPDCAAHCALLVGAACTNGPTDQASCEADCSDALSAGFCTAQHEALVLCSNASGDATCNGSGDVVVTGCETEQADLDACETVCAGADDGNPCTEDECDCTPGDCDPATAISNPPVAAGESCEDEDVCNGTETCDGTGTLLLGPLCGVGSSQAPPRPHGAFCARGPARRGARSTSTTATRAPSTAAIPRLARCTRRLRQARAATMAISATARTPATGPVHAKQARPSTSTMAIPARPTLAIR
jgi:hypothetical protein